MPARLTVADFMSTDLLVLAPECDVQEAVRALVARDVSGAPVVDAQGVLVGILAEKDCFRAAFTASYHHEPAGPVSAFMSPRVETVDADMDVVEAIELFLRGPYRRFPVVRGGRLVGVLTRRDALRAVADLW